MKLVATPEYPEEGQAFAVAGKIRFLLKKLEYLSKKQKIELSDYIDRRQQLGEALTKLSIELDEQIKEIV